MNFAGCSVTEGKRYTKDVKMRAVAKILAKCALHCASSHYISSGKKHRRNVKTGHAFWRAHELSGRHGAALHTCAKQGGSIPPRFLFILNLSFNMFTFGMCASLYVCIAMLIYLSAR